MKIVGINNAINLDTGEAQTSMTLQVHEGAQPLDIPISKELYMTLGEIGEAVLQLRTQQQAPQPKAAQVVPLRPQQPAPPQLTEAQQMAMIEQRAQQLAQQLDAQRQAQQPQVSSLVNRSNGVSSEMQQRAQQAGIDLNQLSPKELHQLEQYVQGGGFSAMAGPPQQEQTADEDGVPSV